MLFEVGSLKFYLWLEHCFCARVSFSWWLWARLAWLIVVIFSWLSKLFRLHFRSLFLYISSFQGRQLEPNQHEIDPNLALALWRRSVCYKLVHALALLFVASLWLTAEIHSFLLLAVSSSGSSPWFVVILGIRKNPKPLCFPLLL